MAIVYVRRLKKGGFLDSGESSGGTTTGTTQDFKKLFT